MSIGGSFFSRSKVSPDSLFEQELKVQVKSVEHVNNQWLLPIRADIVHQSRSGHSDSKIMFRLLFIFTYDIVMGTKLSDT